MNLQELYDIARQASYIDFASLVCGEIGTDVEVVVKPKKKIKKFRHKFKKSK